MKLNKVIKVEINVDRSCWGASYKEGVELEQHLIVTKEGIAKLKCLNSTGTFMGRVDGREETKEILPHRIRQFFDFMSQVSEGGKPSIKVCDSGNWEIIITYEEKKEEKIKGSVGEKWHIDLFNLTDIIKTFIPIKALWGLDYLVDAKELEEE